MYNLLVQTRREHLLRHVNFQEKLVMDLKTLGVLGARQSPVFFPKGKKLVGSKPFFEAKTSLANNVYHVHDVKFHLPILISWCFIANSLKQEWKNLMPGTKKSTGQNCPGNWRNVRNTRKQELVGV